ncbi:MAG: squalene/phytoene synthase family protein [Hyphomicrobium sp.]
MSALTSSGEAEVRRDARQLDYDRYLAALLAPDGTHDDLLTLAAFHGEIARIPASVQEPTMGAVRLQWWRDVAETAAAPEATGSPVADKLRQAIATGRFSLADVTSIIDAYEELLRPGSLTDPQELDAFLAASQGAAFRLAAQVLGAGRDAAPGLVFAAAQSYGRVQLLRALPFLLAKGHNPLADGPTVDWSAVIQPMLVQAREWFAETRHCVAPAGATMMQAIAPAALVGPYLKALERLGSKLVFEQATISPLSRVWRIYMASRRGRF